MNSTIHSQISVKNRGGCIDDYNFIHDFIDSSKEVEASNKHRFLTHTMFFVKEAMIPIFGFTIENSNKRTVNLKDLLEQDHILPDYKGKFIPNLTDFVNEIEHSKDDDQMIKDFQSDNYGFFKEHTHIRDTMMSPLFLTGQIRSLFVTHNSWFVGFILPKIFKDIKIELKNFNISPSYFFNKMEYKPWMQNGNGVPPSFEKIERKKRTRVLEELSRPITTERALKD